MKSGDSWRNGVPVVKIRYTFVVPKNGREHWYFRRGPLQTALPGKPGEPQFHEKYAQLLAQTEGKPVEVPQDTMKALVAAYRASAEFGQLRPPTQLDYSKTLNLIDEHLGDYRFKFITSNMVKTVRDDFAATPARRTRSSRWSVASIAGLRRKSG
jgi:hypothetical protein